MNINGQLLVVATIDFLLTILWPKIWPQIWTLRPRLFYPCRSVRAKCACDTKIRYVHRRHTEFAYKACGSRTFDVPPACQLRAVTSSMHLKCTLSNYLIDRFFSRSNILSSHTIIYFKKDHISVTCSENEIQLADEKPKKKVDLTKKNDFGHSVKRDSKVESNVCRSLSLLESSRFSLSLQEQSKIWHLKKQWETHFIFFLFVDRCLRCWPPQDRRPSLSHYCSNT